MCTRCIGARASSNLHMAAADLPQTDYDYQNVLHFMRTTTVNNSTISPIIACSRDAPCAGLPAMS
jgi:hypothetical protein